MAGAKVGEPILMVDDEPKVLAGYLRHLRQDFIVEVAEGGAQALEKIRCSGPFAVVISDLSMPGMNGIELLGRVKQASPDSVRIMLTGFADLRVAMAAVNDGNVFRFLTKPCEIPVLTRALVDGIRQYRLVKAERQLLEQTLSGAIGMVTDLLALLDPESGGLASRAARRIRQLAEEMDSQELWEMETAALLSQVGQVTLPAALRRKLSKGLALSQEEQELYQRQATMAAKLVSGIPRLEPVGEIILYQGKGYDGSGPPPGGPQGPDLPLGSRALKIILDFEVMLMAGQSQGRALLSLRQQPGLYDPFLLALLEHTLGDEADYDHQEVDVDGLTKEMILAEDLLCGTRSRLLLAKGSHLSPSAIQFIRNYHRTAGVNQPIKVLLPLRKKTAPAKPLDCL